MDFAFTLTDADGRQHSYTGRQHGAMEGLGVVADLDRIAGPVLGEVLAAWAMEGEVSPADVADAADGGTPDLSLLERVQRVRGRRREDGLTPERVSRLVAMATGAEGWRTLWPELLRHVSRDGLPLFHEAANGTLTAAGFDAAYRGNYDEMRAAALLSAWHNGFLLGSGTFAAALRAQVETVAGAWAGLRSGASGDTSETAGSGASSTTPASA